MRCGHCRKDHDTVAEVRACAGITSDTRPLAPAERQKRQNPARRAWNIPEGHYAIDGRDGRPTDFYRVDKPEGKWEGWTFLKMVVGGKPDISIKDWERIEQVLTAIQTDPLKAALRYGVELGICGKCGIHLTKYASRTLGIGPDCAAKVGMASLWSETQRRHEAEQKALA